MDGLNVMNIKNFIQTIEQKLDNLCLVLNNIVSYIRFSVPLQNQSSDKVIKMKDCIKSLLSKIESTQNLCSLDVWNKDYIDNTLDGSILVDKLRNILDEMKFEQQFQRYIPEYILCDQQKDEGKQKAYEEEINYLKQKISCNREEKQQLMNDVFLLQQVINDKNPTQDLSELIQKLREKDKINENLRQQNQDLHSELIQKAIPDQIIRQINEQLMVYEVIIKKEMLEYDNKLKCYEQRFNSNEITIDSLKDHIEQYQKRIKKIQKIWKQIDAGSGDYQEHIIVTLESEIFKLNQNYQKKMQSYTNDNQDLRMKINSLEKLIMTLSNSQNDYQQILIKMKSQNDLISELKFQNTQMRDVLRDKGVLEKRIKELIQIEQKQKELKQKELKEQKKLELKKKEEQEQIIKKQSDQKK